MDHGSPLLKSEAVNISITVVKQDSNRPVFDQPSYIFNISEDTRLDNLVGQVHATQRNPTQGSHIVYKITSGNSEGMFHINSQVYINDVDIVQERVFQVVWLA